jgi:hypothetical protein
VPSPIRCAHDLPVDVCPVCEPSLRVAYDHIAREQAERFPQPPEPDVLETELALPDWLEEFRFDADGATITMRAKAVVRFADGARVATFNYEMSAEHVDAVIDALTRLRDRARQLAQVIDVPSSPPRGRSAS